MMICVLLSHFILCKMKIYLINSICLENYTPVRFLSIFSTVSKNQFYLNVYRFQSCSSYKDIFISIPPSEPSCIINTKLNYKQN